MVDLVIFHSFQWLGPTNSPWFFPKGSRNRIQIGPGSQTLMVLSAQASLDTINRRASLLHQSGGSGGSRFLRMTLMLKPSPLSMGELCVVDMDIINIYIYLFIFICIYNYLYIFICIIYTHTFFYINIYIYIHLLSHLHLDTWIFTSWSHYPSSTIIPLSLKI